PSPHPSPTGRGGETEVRATLGRETPADVVLVPRLRSALERLNPALPPEAITSALDELTHDRSAMLLPAANREVYALLKDGIRVSVPDAEPAPILRTLTPASPKGRGDARGSGGQRTERVRVLDWEDRAANAFLLVSQCR